MEKIHVTEWAAFQNDVLRSRMQVTAIDCAEDYYKWVQEDASSKINYSWFQGMSATAPSAKHHECTQYHGERTLPLCQRKVLL